MYEYMCMYSWMINFYYVPLSKLIIVTPSPSSVIQFLLAFWRQNWFLYCDVRVVGYLPVH